MVLILFFVLVKPAIGAFKQKNIEYRKSEFVYRSTKEEHDKKQKELKAFQEQNRKILNAFQVQFRNDNFEMLSNKYFSSFKVMKVNNELNGTQGFPTDHVQIRSMLKTPKDFYSYILFLNESGHVAQMDFPINFEATREGIVGEFNVRIYNNPK